MNKVTQGKDDQGKDDQVKDDPRKIRTDDPKSRGLPLGGSTGDVDAEGGSRSGSSPEVELSDP